MNCRGPVIDQTCGEELCRFGLYRELGRVAVECEWCEGTGEEEQGIPCEYCEGTGRKHMPACDACDLGLRVVGT